MSDEWTDDPAPGAAPVSTAKADDEGNVKARCIVRTKPWSHEGPLEHLAEVLLPKAVFDAMFHRKQVEAV